MVSQNLKRTIVGASVGAMVAFACWSALVLFAVIDDAAHWHWKAMLFGFGIALPVLCVAGGVIMSRPTEGRRSYLIANLGFTFLATLLTTAALMALLSLELWQGLILSVVAFFGWAFVEERYISAKINLLVQRLTPQPTKSGT